MQLMLTARMHDSRHDSSSQEGAGAAAANDQDVLMLPAGVPAAGAAAAAGSSKPRLVLTLQHADHQPAAIAVLQSLYAVKPIPQLLSELPQELQLHAALLADVWQLPEVSTAAVQALVQSYESGNGLSAAAHEQFLQLEAMPTFLLPLTQKVLAGLAQQQTKAAQVTLRRMLLSVLGDLEEVWADSALRDTLMGLPLPAVATLLRSDHLKVASEDNVLYTAQAYLDGVSDVQERQAAQQLLARLVRAQHLSHFWLAAAALSTQAPSLLVATYQKQLRQLLLFKLGAGGSIDDDITVGMKTSELRWELPVSKLMSTAQLSAAQKQLIGVDSPIQTPPMNGVSFGVLIQASWQSNAQGSSIGVLGFKLSQRTCLLRATCLLMWTLVSKG